MPFKISDYAAYKPKEAIKVGATEKVIENVAVFNDDSLGCIGLDSKLITQDLKSETFIQAGVDPTGDRDPNNVEGEFPSIDLSVSDRQEYRVHKLLKSLKTTNAAVKDFYETNYASGIPQNTLTRMLDDKYSVFKGIGANHATWMLKGIRETGISALASAIASQASLISKDGTLASPIAANKMNPTVFTSLDMVYKAHRGLLKCYVMRSESVALFQNDIILNKRIVPVNYSTGAVGSATIYTFADKRIVEVDDPALQSVISVGGEDKTVNLILTLQEGAINCSLDEINLDEDHSVKGHNFIRTIAGVYDTAYKIKGFKLKAAVTSLYTKAKFGVALNWEKDVQQDLDCAGAGIYHRID